VISAHSPLTMALKRYLGWTCPRPLIVQRVMVSSLELTIRVIALKTIATFLEDLESKWIRIIKGRMIWMMISVP
jgi:hypothetical protein